MGSYYQSVSYLKGGKKSRTCKSRNTRNTRKSRNTRKGGFYPSVMSGVMRYGSYLVPIAMRHGMRMMNSKKIKKHKSKHSKKSKTMRKKIQA